MRSKIKWIKNDERPNKVFLRLEKTKAQQSTITSLTKPSGQNVSSMNDILEHAEQYYSNLWNNDHNSNDDNLNTWATKLPADVLKNETDLDLPFAIEELNSSYPKLLQINLLV